MPLVEPIFTYPRRDALATYQRLCGTGQTSDKLEEILAGAFDGRVRALFLDLAHKAFGTFDPSTRKAKIGEEPGPGDVDLLASLARWTYRGGGDLFAGQPPQIPEGSPVSAIFRYA